MTSKQRKYYEREREFVFKQAGYCCEICHEYIGHARIQAAHMVPAHENLIEQYGPDKIYSRYNIRATEDAHNKDAQLPSWEWDAHMEWVGEMIERDKKNEQNIKNFR